MFIHLNDGTDAFQVLLKRDVLGEDVYNAAKLLDLGDFIGVKGTLFTTQAGEKTVEVAEWELLSKAIRQPPEKWHGLQDTEERYRRRYLDLMSNPESRARFDKRHKIILGIRNYLTSKGFIEVETPIMQGQAGGAAAKPFVTHHNALDREMVLRIAPELYLKRLIVGGFDKVFELGKDFRNEGIDRTHNPEFTVLEVYEAYGDRTSMKNIIEGLLPYLCDTVLGTRQVPYGENGEIINFEPPYREVTQQDLIKEKMGADWFELDYETARARAAAAGLELVDEITDMVTLSHEVYDKMIEGTLRQPTFVTRIPKQYVPLAKACPDDPSLVDVFEFVVAGKELCPGYTEQNDPEAQRAAFANQVEADAEPTDQDFVEALEYGMPPTGGLGLGIDRLVMFMTGADCIRDVILFPQMKSEK
jgi:lysyl-tRNA synthetase class 2